jgi:hypothetical protein
MDDLIYYRYQYLEYQSRLMRNRSIISETISTPSDTDLYKLLTRYNCNVGDKLLWLLEFFENYDMKVSFHETRGIEMACPLDLMVARAGGAKRTWRRAIMTLCMMGLLNQFRPRVDERDIRLNTPAQDYSAARTNEVKRHPVTWYNVPEYTPAVLAVANERAAKALQFGSGIDKDIIRYSFGVPEANRICDTGYPKAKWRVEMEQSILQAIHERLKTDGYTTLNDALEAAQRLTEHDRNDILTTWRSYRLQLFNEEGIRYGRPTAQQKADFHLESDKWIITKVE